MVGCRDTAKRIQKVTLQAAAVPEENPILEAMRRGSGFRV